MSLPLVDVNSETAATSWPLLTSAISSADFIALDLVYVLKLVINMIMSYLVLILRS